MVSAATEWARSSRAHSSHRAPVLRPDTPARTGHACPRAPTHVRTPPSATPKATRFPRTSALRLPPTHVSTGPSAAHRSPAHFHACAIPTDSKGQH
ncbi:hypothetical protein GCM10010348_25030 [Streptomyces anthocyanicus]|nr:hypothetical protein JCM4020_41270 [Streptomyces coelicolor]GHA69214.1 hypothetical protein GCM10010391_63620 [Streptomyces anthocyanicus]GHC02906.1 hypothetical protein GCM10010348_25030 [Streptomyces anthocyanicus]